MSRIDARSRRRRQQAEGDLDAPGLLGPDDAFDHRAREWRGMPEFIQRDLMPHSFVEVKIPTEDGAHAFERVMGQKLARSMWYPPLADATFADKRYHVTDGRPRTPTYPLYIVSKGRADRQITSRYLTEMGIPHYVVVERDQLWQYQMGGHDCATFLVLDPSFQRDYDRMLPHETSPGSGAARNFAWHHSTSLGAARHWVMDDNIEGFYRLNRNAKIRVADGMFFRVMEAFADRYANVAMAGPAYDFLIRRRNMWAPIITNTRIYSCNLIRNDVVQRWRGRYNEDTILSIDLLKAGYCTVQFYTFLQRKMATQSMAGGNTTEFYAEEGTLPKSKMLVDAHPDVATLIQRYGRWHHYVDWPAFQHRLKLRPDVVVPDEPDEFGMVLEQRDAEGIWHAIA